MKIKYLITIIFLVLLTTGFIGCDLLKKKVDKQETSVYTINSTGKTRLKIKNIYGEIKVSKAKDSLKTVRVTAIKTGKVKQQDLDKPLENIKIKVDTASEIISFETEIQKESGWFKKSSNGAVDYEVSVPENIRVTIDNVNGGLILENLNGDIDASLVNGRVNMESCSGNVNLSVTNGEISANIDSTKGMKMDVTNGGIKIGRLKNVSADIYASTVNGKVKHDELSLKNESSDRKNVKGTLGEGKNSIKLSSVNGSITLSQSDVLLKTNIRRKHDDFEGLKFDLDFDDNDDNTVIHHDKIPKINDSVNGKP